MINKTPLQISADITINQSTHQVFQNGRKLNLSELSYKTLLELINHAPNIVSINHLMDSVWKDIEVNPETVTQRIALIRKSLNVKTTISDGYITSIRNQGYRWNHLVKDETDNKVKPILTKFLFLIIIFFVLAGLTYIYINHKDPIKQAATLPEITTQIKSVEDEYLSQAWFYLEKHDLNSNQIAVDLFKKALEKKPVNIKAMIGLSFALSHQVTKFNQPHELLDEAKKHASNATNLDPKNAAAWSALGFVYDANGEINQAISLYQKAIKLNPNDVSSKGSLSYLYSQKGQIFDSMQINMSILGSRLPYLNLQVANNLEILGFESIAEIWYQKADELSPDNVFATHQRARFYISHDQNSKARSLVEDALNRGIKRPELYVINGMLDWSEQQNNQAIKQFEKALEIDPEDFEANLWYFMATHNQQSPQQDLQQFEDRWFQELGDWPNVAVYHAMYLAHMGKFDEAISSLELSFEKGFLNHRWLKKLPPLLPIIDKPRYMSLIEKMQNEISNQRQQLLKADWLPKSFLDPQEYLRSL